MKPNPADNINLATVDTRVFFEKVLAHGVQRGLVDDALREAMIGDAAKGTIQVADYFGTSHLFVGLDSARKRIVHLVSLYLEYQYGSDLADAVQSLRLNSFLSHSRGGNDLLKKLHALPESTMFDGSGQSLKEFQDERTLAKPMACAAYRKELKRRQANAVSLVAARWFAQDMGVPITALEFVDADVVIRTALLNRIGGNRSWPNQQEFAQRIDSFRGQRVAVPATVFKFSKALLDDVPEKFQVIALKVGKEIAAHDVPVIANQLLALDRVVHTLEARYFLRETGLEDMDAHEAVVSKEWHELTRGKEDPYSRLTLFVCLAAGVKPKTSLSATETRALIRRVRKQGFDRMVVPALIIASAPYAIRSALLTMWEEEFFPEAELRLMDDADDKLIYAMQFLTENCNIGKK